MGFLKTEVSMYSSTPWIQKKNNICMCKCRGDELNLNRCNTDVKKSKGKIKEENRFISISFNEICLVKFVTLEQPLTSTVTISLQRTFRASLEPKSSAPSCFPLLHLYSASSSPPHPPPPLQLPCRNTRFSIF